MNTFPTALDIQKKLYVQFILLVDLILDIAI